MPATVRPMAMRLTKRLPPNQPIRVSLFDVDYVLARTTVAAKGGEGEVKKEEEEEVYAMLDSCPHKKVALSEGRITDRGTPDKRYFQCSYHGEIYGLL